MAPPTGEGTGATTLGANGRYEILGEIASGGMATVYLARMIGAKGFTRLVAIKRLHPHLANEEDFVAMFLDEARLAARIRHQNVVATLDVDDRDGLYLVMEYIEGDRLLGLLRHAVKTGERIPPTIALRIAVDTLAGLQAAHELRDDDDSAFNLVHRDVSPQNILVGVDGVSRLTDFGIAKAASRMTVTRDGALKGKIAYMAPEQTRRVEIDRRVDVFAMGIIAWEMLTAKKLFTGESDVEVLNQLLFEPIPRVRDHSPGLPAGLDLAVMKALERDPAKRYASASDFADALERASRVFGGPANTRTVGAYVQRVAAEKLARDRARAVGSSSPPPAHARTDGPGSGTPSGVKRLPPVDPPHETLASSDPTTTDPVPPRAPVHAMRPRAATLVGVAPVVQPVIPPPPVEMASLDDEDDDDELPTQAFDRSAIGPALAAAAKSAAQTPSTPPRPGGPPASTPPRPSVHPASMPPLPRARTSSLPAVTSSRPAPPVESEPEVPIESDDLDEPASTMELDLDDAVAAAEASLLDAPAVSAPPVPAEPSRSITAPLLTETAVPAPPVPGRVSEAPPLPFVIPARPPARPAITARRRALWIGSSAVAMLGIAVCVAWLLDNPAPPAPAASVTAVRPMPVRVVPVAVVAEPVAHPSAPLAAVTPAVDAAVHALSDAAVATIAHDASVAMALGTRTGSLPDASVTAPVQPAVATRLAAPSRAASPEHPAAAHPVSAERPVASSPVARSTGSRASARSITAPPATLPSASAVYGPVRPPRATPVATPAPVRPAPARPAAGGSEDDPFGSSNPYSR